MDPGVVDELDDAVVALLVLIAEVLGQVDDQLSAHGLVAVHVGDVFKLRLACRQNRNSSKITSTEEELHLLFSFFL